MKAKTKRGHPVGVRFPLDLSEKINRLSKKTQLSNQDIILQAVIKGLPEVEDFFSEKKAA